MKRVEVDQLLLTLSIHPKWGGLRAVDSDDFHTFSEEIVETFPRSTSEDIATSYTKIFRNQI